MALRECFENIRSTVVGSEAGSLDRTAVRAGPLVRSRERSVRAEKEGV